MSTDSLASLFTGSINSSGGLEEAASRKKSPDKTERGVEAFAGFIKTFAEAADEQERKVTPLKNKSVSKNENSEVASKVGKLAGDGLLDRRQISHMSESDWSELEGWAEKLNPVREGSQSAPESSAAGSQFPDKDIKPGDVRIDQDDIADDESGFAESSKIAATQMAAPVDADVVEVEPEGDSAAGVDIDIDIGIDVDIEQDADSPEREVVKSVAAELSQTPAVDGAIGQDGDAQSISPEKGTASTLAGRLEDKTEQPAQPASDNADQESSTQENAGSKIAQDVSAVETKISEAVEKLNIESVSTGSDSADGMLERRVNELLAAGGDAKEITDAMNLDSVSQDELKELATDLVEEIAPELDAAELDLDELAEALAEVSGEELAGVLEAKLAESDSKILKGVDLSDLPSVVVRSLSAKIIEAGLGTGTGRDDNLLDGLAWNNALRERLTGGEFSPVSRAEPIAPEMRHLEQPAAIAGMRQLDNVERIENIMRLSVQRGIQSVQVQLNPDNLGRVTMELHMKNGVLTATLNVENEDAKRVLANGLEQLRQNLQRHDITLGSFDVNTQGGREGGQSDQARYRTRNSGKVESAGEVESADNQAFSQPTGIMEDGSLNLIV